DRTAAGTAPTLRAHALWAEYRGDWAAAVARSLESIALEPETFYSYGRAWECSARFKADERQDLWNRIEPLFVNSTGRLTIARDVMALIAGRFGIAAAEKTIESWRAARPDDPDILEAAADLLIDHGHGRSDGARAISLLEPAVRRYPYHPGLRFSLANAYHRAGRDPDAEAVLVEIVRRHPNISAAKIRLAWIRSRQGDEEGAKRYLDEAMAAEPRNSDLIGCRAQILIDHGRFDEAIRVIEGGLGRLPLDARWRDRAVSLLARCGAADQAIRAARGGVEADPGSAYPWLVLGRTLNDMRQYAEVGEIERCCRKSLELNGALFEAAELLALLLTEQRQYDDASKIMLDIEPRLTDPSPARGRLAWIRRQRGQKSEAVADLANVLEDHPWFGWGWSVLMDWLEEDAAPDQTRQRLQTIPPPMYTDTSFRLRRLLLLEKARAEGTQLDEEWSGLLRDFPEDVSLHVRRYDVLADARRWPEAAAVIDAIETIEPDDPFILARRCEVLARDHQKEAALEVALRVGFRPVEEYTWPAEKVWDVARTEGFAGDLFSRVRQRLMAGDKPTLQSFSRMAAYAMRNEAKRHSQPRPLIWFPRGGAREVVRLVDLVSGAPWDGSVHRAIAYDLLCDYGYGRLVAKLAAKIAPADVTAADEWGQIGRAFIDGHLYADARRFFRAWRERTGVAMWMVANYVLSLSRFRRDELRERYDSARDALAGLPHDYCAKYLAHIQAEASALLGRNDLFLETWASHARFFDGQLDDGSYFAKKDRYLLTSIPRLADDLTQHRAGRARRTVLKLWLRRLVPSWVALKPEGHKGTDTSLILISLVLLSVIARTCISQTSELIDIPAPPTLSERGLSPTGPIVGGRTGSPGQQSPGRPSAAAPDRFSLAIDNRDLVATVTRTIFGRTSYGAMGEVFNKSAKTFHFVMVKVEFCDRWGRVVGTLMTEGNRNEYVLPGRAISFTVQRNGKLDYATAKASIAYSVEVK
ncbi:MAG: tetratricopeptide repeat protein, partial [Candidatus Aminicenantes bacterium RBG_16_66_30]